MSDSPKCCGTPQDPMQQVRDLYTALAQQPERDFGWGKGKTNARDLGYDPAWLETLPESVWESAAAVGNPFSVGSLTPGEVIVDVGCGAGADLCIAARLVGESGRAIGLDLTPAMVAKARDNARRAGVNNVTVHEADIAALPLPDACADVVISNGAINLAADKARVFHEIYRILRPGGRLQFADMVRRASLETEAVGCGSWADCVAGTVAPGHYLALLQTAGFRNVVLVAWTGYHTGANTEGATFRAAKP